MTKPFASALAAPLHPEAAAAFDEIDFLHAPFEMRRVLDWGDRPNWSPDGRRLAFTEFDTKDGPAYQLDLASGEVRCLTCRWGPKGLVTRIYHLPDSSFLIEAGRDLGNSSSEEGGGSRTGLLTTELYWMPPSAATPPQPLNVDASGEVAISPRTTPGGGFRIAWSLVFTLGQMMTGELVHDGSRAAVTSRRTIRPKPAPAPLGGYGEPYDFARDDEALTFWGFEPTLDGEMFEIDVSTGAVRHLYQHPSHNETHLLPNERFGLEESNRASDPDGLLRGISGFIAGVPGVGGPFDLFVIALDGSNHVRRLTHVSDIGGQANQSVPAPDGRRVAFVLDAPSSGPHAGMGGLYVGEFKT
ncbi:MAG: hypothetical protein WEB06_01175 [Actinomycetota bacterium]